MRQASGSFERARRSRLLRITTLAALLAAAFEPARPSEEDRPGKMLFDAYCSACHQYDEQGMGEAPPLDGSPWVVGPPERLVLIILHGVKGRIEVRGTVYDREMPGFGGSLGDSEIAVLASYARERFGADRPEVESSDVAAIRQRHAGRTEYWDAAGLLSSSPAE